MGDLLESCHPGPDGLRGKLVKGKVAKGRDEMVSDGGFIIPESGTGRLLFDRYEPGFEGFPDRRNLCLLAGSKILGRIECSLGDFQENR